MQGENVPEERSVDLTIQLSVRNSDSMEANLAIQKAAKESVVLSIRMCVEALSKIEPAPLRIAVFFTLKEQKT